MKPGATSGFRWVTSGGLPGNITIFGAALLTNDAATLLGVQALDAPITLTADGQQIDFDPLTMLFIQTPIS